MVHRPEGIRVRTQHAGTCQQAQYQRNGVHTHAWQQCRALRSGTKCDNSVSDADWMIMNTHPIKAFFFACPQPSKHFSAASGGTAHHQCHSAALRQPWHRVVCLCLPVREPTALTGGCAADVPLIDLQYRVIEFLQSQPEYCLVSPGLIYSTLGIVRSLQSASAGGGQARR